MVCCQGLRYNWFASRGEIVGQFCQNETPGVATIMTERSVQCSVSSTPHTPPVNTVRVPANIDNY